MLLFIAAITFFSLLSRFQVDLLRARIFENFEIKCVKSCCLILSTELVKRHFRSVAIIPESEHFSKSTSVKMKTVKYLPFSFSVAEPFESVHPNTYLKIIFPGLSQDYANDKRRKTL